MLKLVIKHKIFEYALNNMFNKLLCNLKNPFMNVKVGDVYTCLIIYYLNDVILTYKHCQVIEYDSVITILSNNLYVYSKNPSLLDAYTHEYDFSYILDVSENELLFKSPINVETSYDMCYIRSISTY